MPGRGSSFVIVKTTLGRAAAKRLAHQIVKERLAACANILPIESEYWWKGKLERSREALVSFKTTRSRSARLVARIRRLHPHEVPYVSMAPLSLTEPSYARWVEESVRGR